MLYPDIAFLWERKNVIIASKVTFTSEKTKKNTLIFVVRIYKHFLGDFSILSLLDLELKPDEISHS